jgi:uncharacterized protein YdgA (DUF945 family)
MKSASATLVSEKQSTSDYEEPKIIGAYYEEQPANKSERRTSTKASVDQTKNDGPVESETRTHFDNDGDEDPRVVGAFYEEPVNKVEKEKSRTSNASVDQPKNDDLIEAEALCARFKETLSQENAKVHFVGAW